MDVCLVSMPYAAVERPSIALGLLAAELRGAGLTVDVRYPALAFAARIGLRTYDAILNSRTTHFIGEWTFAAAAFPEMPEVDADYLRMIAESVEEDVLLAVREEARRLVETFAEDIVASGARIVGCTSTFQQHVASLALLRAVRERAPDVITIIGGTNCESWMGIATKRAFPWVDYVVSGEADELIVPFVRDLLARDRGVVPPEGVIDASVAQRLDVDPPRASVWAVDSIPTPDYDDYFDALARSPLRDAVEPALVIETSRGCWWGAKSHCTFCGLNGGNMAYRAKTPARAVEEFHRLFARYGVRRFTAVDNIIDMQYHQGVLPQLAGHGYDIFYETKANLRRRHMEGFAEAGARSIQPGMESFHDDALQLLAKGNKAWMNVQLLKWADELSMEISWVFLIDIPGQRDEWYIEMLRWLPFVMHLAPPVYATSIQFVRFSPYHRDPARYGLSITTAPAYAHVYPLRGEELERLAYYFVDREPIERGGIGQRLVVSWLGIWRDAHHGADRPRLELRREGDALQIVDTRPCRTAERHRLSGLAARLYEACDEASDRATLRSRLEVTEKELEAAALPLLADHLLLDLGGRLLALAVDADARQDIPRPSPGGLVAFGMN